MHRFCDQKGDRHQPGFEIGQAVRESLDCYLFCQQAAPARFPTNEKLLLIEYDPEHLSQPLAKEEGGEGHPFLPSNYLANMVGGDGGERDPEA